MVGISGAITDRSKSYANDEFATFVTKPGVGKSHQILFRPTKEETVQETWMDAPRRQAIRGSGRVIRFAESALVTPDQEVIDFLLGCSDFRDGHIDINRHDPTGYWAKNAEQYGLTVNRQEVVEVKGDLSYGQGAMSSAQRRVV
jgi:hypothetical protein